MTELPKSYSPADHEEKLYSMWERSGAFQPVSDFEFRASNFSMIMPPPNANGLLHIGHAVFVTLEDLMTRYHRMKGEPTLWLPGADHAGFETQVVYEKKLEKLGKSRFDFERDDLYQQMRDFTQSHRQTMENQLRKLGASCDWSRLKFTLDPDIIDIVYATFKKLYDDGLAYRDLAIVNWCTRHQTSLSDLETKYLDRQEPFYYLKYGPFIIATARPETKFGDKYIVVHPKDKRYKKYKNGQKFQVDWLNGKIEATLVKDKAIDMNFGTGAMTITPWHDPIDFELAKRHNLDMEPIIDKNGKLLPIAGDPPAGGFAGLHVKKARPLIVEKLKKMGLLVKVDENYQHAVQVCYKCTSVIEPMVLKQWHIAMTREVKNRKLKVKSLRDLGLEAVQKGKVKFVSKRFEKIYNHWLSNIRDWNISRQIVWGIPINAWYCIECNDTFVEKPNTVTIYGARHGEAVHNAKNILSGDPKKVYHLTAKGKTQAKALARAFKDINFDAVYASQFLRTKDTAKAFAGRAKVIIDKRLNDIVTGDLEGVNHDQAQKLSKGWTKSVGGSETLLQIKRRVIDFLGDVAKKHHHQTIAAVTSEIILHAIENISHQHKLGERVDGHPETGSFERFVISTPLNCKNCGGYLKRDSDVFDTWFSSGQWPFAALLAQSRENSKLKTQNSKPLRDFERFYPTTVMETGHDILFFWVARMIMLGQYVTGEVPFKYVYLHGLVRDKDRQKMSKSKGNVVDPLGVAEQYGTDALRMALVFGSAAGSDIIISEEKIRGMRNFANKVWNVSRFIMINLDNLKSKNEKVKSKLAAQLEKEVEKLTKQVTADIDNFRFHQAAEKLYSFTWHRFADYYIEESKKGKISPSLLVTCYLLLVTLLHPFMPFVTEAVWQEFHAQGLVKEKMLISAEWPKQI